MKFSVDRAEFVQMLALIVQSIDKAETMPLRLCVKISTVTDTAITIDAGTFEHRIIAHIDAQVSGRGECAVGARRLFSILKLAITRNVVFHLEGDYLHFACGSLIGRLYSLDPEGMPAIPEMEHVCSVSIPANVLRSAVESAMPYVYKNDGRLGIDCIMLECARDDGCLRMVATDGHRMMIHRMRHDAPEGMPDLLIPRAAAALMSAILKRQIDVDLNIGVVSRIVQATDRKTGIRPPDRTIYGLTLHVGPVVFHARMNDADFPDYRLAVPKSLPFHVTIARRPIVQFCRMALAMRRSHYPVRITAGKDSIDVATIMEVGVGDIADVIHASIKGDADGVYITLNERYLYAAVRSAKGELVTLQLNHAQTMLPVVIENDDETIVIMAIRG